VAARPDIGQADAASPVCCDHDGKANGRLVLEHGALRREIICDCGQVLALLGRQEYHVGDVADARASAGARWRRSRAFITAFGARRRSAPGHAPRTRLARRA
jgi:hypothetical protein